MSESPWRQILLSMSLLTQVGLVVVISIIIGLLLGQWLDGLLGTRLVFSLLGMLLGIGGGMVSAFRLLQKAFKDDNDGTGTKGS